MEEMRIEENYFPNATQYVPFLVDEASYNYDEDSIKFKILANHESIGWVLPVESDFDVTKVTKFTIEHYRDIAENTESITEIAMRIHTKDNIHYSLKPYLHEGKMVIFQ